MGQGTYLRIEGFEPSVRYRLGRLQALLAQVSWSGIEALERKAKS